MITLLVLTKNRSDFLIRLLRYYEDTGFEGCICIADGSGPDHVERTKRMIETLRGKFSIVYKGYPDLTLSECLKRLLDFVSTPYAAFCGDDDFLIPSALNKCAKFLDDHPDYAFAHGKGVNIALDKKGPYGRIVDCSCYQQDEIEAESASQRLDYYLRHGHITIFSVHRSEYLRVMYRDSYVLKDVVFGSELIPCCHSIILGKSKQLDCFHVVRQGHAQQIVIRSGYNWITNPEWYSGYRVFRDSLAEALALQDNISIVEAQKTVNHAFCALLNNPDFLCSPTNKNSHSLWVRVGRKIPGAQRIWQFLHSFSGVSLSALLRSSSPYHSDFMPVYKALTTPPTEFLNETTGK